jgi:hypothetical protein
MPTLMFKTKVFLRSLCGESVWSIVQRTSFAPRHRLARLVQRRTGKCVSSGPFRGVHYLHDAVSGGYIPKLLGIYERELHPIIATLQEHGISTIINIGASDGYYAVGLARCLPAARVIAFELEPRGQDFVRRIAEKNGVGDRMTVKGRCDMPDLQAAVAGAGRTLVICDIEGYEDVLMDPEKVPALRSAWILVELHDGKNPGVSERLHARFRSTHSIDTIWQQKRTENDFPFSDPYTQSLDPRHLAAAVDEGRPVRDGSTPMSWFWMIPHHT